jgi:hypothetical protein
MSLGDVKIMEELGSVSLRYDDLKNVWSPWLHKQSAQSMISVEREPLELTKQGLSF